MHHIHGYKYCHSYPFACTKMARQLIVVFCLMTLKLAKADIDGEAYIIHNSTLIELYVFKQLSGLLLPHMKL